ncbi:ABC transporter permease [Brachybacterium sp. NBEC-018]|uniref:ABC transporter permease n=1 Tax=Brachybacterium sp. NBEC-018 TaxID=2996004 RepID=UPI00217519C6|nr:ABC transporter permease [Brachybacterium sp. NBEC-018]UVY84161.1 ABC transporter permease [Brachybacterium sp. NBEC-018]
MRFVARRLLHGALVVWAAYTVTWLLLFLLPSDPVSIMLTGSGNASPETRAALEAKYGLDRPPFLQYLLLLGRAATGDLGDSIEYGRPVTDIVLGAVPYTVQLGLAALAVSIVVGLGVALLANTARAAWLRTILFSLPSVFLSFPVFLTGLLLVQVFAFSLHLLPAVGTTGWKSLLLPALTSGIPASAAIAQVTTAAIRDYLESPQASYLRARGVTRPQILLAHALRNALVPAMTILGMQVGGILAGAVITETVFSRQGLGRVLQAGVLSQDIPLVQGVVVLSALLFVLSSLLVDLVHPLIDPRVRKA